MICITLFLITQCLMSVCESSVIDYGYPFKQCLAGSMLHFVLKLFDVSIRQLIIDFCDSRGKYRLKFNHNHPEGSQESFTLGLILFDKFLFGVYLHWCPFWPLQPIRSSLQRCKLSSTKYFVCVNVGFVVFCYCFLCCCCERVLEVFIFICLCIYYDAFVDYTLCLTIDWVLNCKCLASGISKS